MWRKFYRSITCTKRVAGKEANSVAPLRHETCKMTTQTRNIFPSTWWYAAKGRAGMSSQGATYRLCSSICVVAFAYMRCVENQRAGQFFCQSRLVAGYSSRRCNGFLLPTRRTARAGFCRYFFLARTCMYPAPPPLEKPEARERVGDQQAERIPSRRAASLSNDVARLFLWRPIPAFFCQYLSLSLSLSPHQVSGEAFFPR